MFNLTRRFRHQTVAVIEDEQMQLDAMRYNNANDPLMQLHLDRMQTALNKMLTVH